MIKKQIRVSDINKDDYPFILFDILLTTNINDIGIKEPYVYPEWMPGEEYLKSDKEGGDIILHGNKIYKCIISHQSSDSFESDSEKWKDISDLESISNIITYSGESRIDEFKRYGKTINDSDLYNTENPINDGGITKRIIETKPKIDPFSKQYIYKYTFTDSNDNVTTYDDVGDGSSIITYETKGLNENNAINLPSFKNEELLSVIGKPKVEVDVFIDRGINNSFDKHIKIGEIKTLESLEKYGNGVFKIKE